MDSPFPGMDPYLEQHWRSVHHRLITYAGDQLQAQLPQRYRVEVEERVFVVGDGDSRRVVVPDVSVVERPETAQPHRRATDGKAIAEPVVIELSDEPVTESYLEIIDTASGNQVVAALEFLSPTNKMAGDGNDLYVKKQREYRAGGVSQVEVDLTRTGDRNLVFPMTRIPRHHRALYLACVRRSWQPTRIEAYPLTLQQPLPSIGVPLQEHGGDVSLDLQSLVELCYRNGRYDDLDYRQEPVPSLPAEDAAWADRRLRERGLR